MPTFRGTFEVILANNIHKSSSHSVVLSKTKSPIVIYEVEVAANHICHAINRIRKYVNGTPQNIKLEEVKEKTYTAGDKLDVGTLKNSYVPNLGIVWRIVKDDGKESNVCMTTKPGISYLTESQVDFLVDFAFSEPSA